MYCTFLFNHQQSLARTMWIVSLHECICGMRKKIIQNLANLYDLELVVSLDIMDYQTVHFAFWLVPSPYIVTDLRKCLTSDAVLYDLLQKLVRHSSACLDVSYLYFLCHVAKIAGRRFNGNRYWIFYCDKSFTYGKLAWRRSDCSNAIWADSYNYLRPKCDRLW
jgi:hypothetical protein